jgi:hypothetical protein
MWKLFVSIIIQLQIFILNGNDRNLLRVLRFIDELKAKRIRVKDNMVVRRLVKMKNKAKKKAMNDTKKENQTKNKGKKDWKQR